MGRGKWRGHEAGSATYRRLVVALMAGGLSNFSLMYFVQPLLPLLASHYGVSAAESAHALSVTTLTMMAGLLVAGPLADRVGRVKVMRWSLVISGVLGLATAFAPSWSALVALRGVQGLSFAGLPVAAMAYLREEVDAASHPRANGTYIAGTAVGGAVARLLPVPLSTLGGWPVVATVMSLLTLAAGVALWLLLPAARGFAPRRVGLRHAVLGTVTAPRDPVIALLCVAGFAAMGTFVGIFNAVAFRLQAPPFSLGVAATVVYLAYPVGILAPQAIRLLGERIGRGWATVIGTGVLAVGVVLISPPQFAMVMSGLGVITAAFLATHSSLSGWAVERAQRRGAGTAQASGAYLLTYYLGSTIAGALATRQWQDSGWPGVEALGLGLAALAVVAAFAASGVDAHATVTESDAPQA